MSSTHGFTITNNRSATFKLDVHVIEGGYRVFGREITNRLERREVERRTQSREVAVNVAAGFARSAFANDMIDVEQFDYITDKLADLA